MRVEQETRSPSQPAGQVETADIVPECLITDKAYGGGAVADNQTVNTKAIQAAIDECHAQNWGRVHKTIFLS